MFSLILGVVHLVVLHHHASFHLLHQVPPDGTRCDSVDQVKNRQAGANQRVLHRQQVSEHEEEDIKKILKCTLFARRAHLEAFDLRAFVFLSQGGVNPVDDDVVGHLLAITKVRQDHQSVPECPTSHRMNTDLLDQVSNEALKREI